MNRIKQLDGLRGIAVILVLLFHYLNNSYSNSESTYLNQFEISISKITSIGWVGVNLFFVLSGFLIATTLLNNRKSSSFFSTFYLRRFSRIIPIYFLLLLLYFFFASYFKYIDTVLFEKPIPLYHYFLFIQNFVMSSQGHFGPNALTPTWSLAVEEQFYLLIPFLIFYLTDKQLLFCCLLLMSTSPIFRFYSSNWYQEYTHFLSRMDAPCYGVLAALLIKNKNWWIFLKKNLFILFGTFIILIFLFLVMHFKCLNHSIISIVFFFALLGILELQANHFIYKLLSSKLFTTIGLYSYFIYLYHQLINGLLFLSFSKNLNPVLENHQDYLIEITALLITFILAKVSYKYLESKFIAFSHQYVY
jgi:peptidoglycan/LPS O-acetylase OafA/YrhL